ncbi:hypothetical protein, partial [Peribacillus muralis]|uniref:hypothetical protein n=1 Tax=Peribacillus muralis TaxID=264697 RepID=UPI003D2B52FA
SRTPPSKIKRSAIRLVFFRCCFKYFEIILALGIKTKEIKGFCLSDWGNKVRYFNFHVQWSMQTHIIWRKWIVEKESAFMLQNAFFVV